MTHENVGLIEDRARATSAADTPRSPASVVLEALLVDADAAELPLFRAALHGMSTGAVRVRQCATAEEAKIVLTRERFDVAFVDTRLGGASGLDLVRAVGGVQCATPLVVVTGAMRPGLEEEARLAGAIDVLGREEITAGVLRRVIRHAQSNHEALRRLIRNDEELRAAAEKAEAANLAKSRFLAQMSHEFRTPLNAIIGFAEMIEKEVLGGIDGRNAHRYRAYAGDIRESGVHLLRLVNEILDLAKVESGHYRFRPQPVDLAHVVDKVVTMTRPQLQKKGHGFHYSLPTVLPPLVADERLATQALLNVLHNAVKFTPDGGSVGIVVEVGEAVEITVTDTGIGIAAGDIDRVVEPFVQVENIDNRLYEGTGLGLPLVKKVMEMHGGGLAIASEIGKGTSVSLTFPRVEEPPAA